MQVERVKLDRARARELYRAYKTHAHYSEPVDAEIRRAYQLLAQGRLVIRALESIRLAGLNEQGLPKLSIVRADAKECFVRLSHDGAGRFSAVNGWGTDHWHRHQVFLPSGSFPRPKSYSNEGSAIVPLIPVHLRPKRALANYHVLWEAEWTKIVPRDPYLLRRIGKGDMWLVVAMWNLTEIERAALAARLNG